MNLIYRARDYIRAFFSKYDRYLNLVLRFIFAVTLYMVIILNTGYSTAVSSPFAAVLLAAAVAMLPVSTIALGACLLVVVEMASVSVETAVITMIFLLVMLLMYYVFRMGDSILMAASLLVCLLRMPALILPLALVFPPVKIIPVIFGIVIYGVIIVVKKDFSVLAKQSGSLTLAGRVNLFLSDFFSNEKLLLILLAVVLTMLVIRAVRMSRVNRAAMNAMIFGDVLFGSVMIFGNYYLNAGISYVMLALSLILNAAVSFVILCFRFNLDYRRSENLQFEDDDYYYYVKAIPKTSISVAEKRVENISSAGSADIEEPKDIQADVPVQDQERE